jgi:hypothetical protein
LIRAASREDRQADCSSRLDITGISRTAARLAGHRKTEENTASVHRRALANHPTPLNSTVIRDSLKSALCTGSGFQEGVGSMKKNLSMFLRALPFLLAENSEWLPAISMM